MHRVHCPPYLTELKSLQLAATEIYKMLKQSVNKPAAIEWARLIVLPPTTNVPLHFCDEYQKFNTRTARDSYSLSRFDECIDSLGTSNISSKIEANSSYLQIEIDLSNRKKTVVTSQHGPCSLREFHVGSVFPPPRFKEPRMSSSHPSIASQNSYIWRTYLFFENPSKTAWPISVKV